MHPAVQVDESILQSGFILLPRHPIHPGGCFALHRIKALPQQLHRDMMEQGGELQLLVFPCCFAHTCQSLGHACPALCRARVGLIGVFLDQRPSLPTLRGPACVFVRTVHRYYAVVRLLHDVRAGLAAMAFTRQPAVFRRRHGGLPVLVHEVSRRALGSTTTGDCSETRAPASAHVAFHIPYSVGIPIAPFRSSITQPTDTPVYASSFTSRCPTQNSGPSGSLLPSRKTLSFST